MVPLLLLLLIPLAHAGVWIEADVPGVVYKMEKYSPATFTLTYQIGSDAEVAASWNFTLLSPQGDVLLVKSGEVDLPASLEVNVSVNGTGVYTAVLRVISGVGSAAHTADVRVKGVVGVSIEGRAEWEGNDLRVYVDTSTLCYDPVLPTLRMLYGGDRFRIYYVVKVYRKTVLGWLPFVMKNPTFTEECNEEFTRVFTFEGLKKEPYRVSVEAIPVLFQDDNYVDNTLLLRISPGDCTVEADAPHSWPYTKPYPVHLSITCDTYPADVVVRLEMDDSTVWQRAVFLQSPTTFDVNVDLPSAPGETVYFTATIEGDADPSGNEAVWSVFITEDVPPEIEYFDVRPATVEVGEKVTAEWRVVDESPVEVTLDCGNGEVYEGLPAEGSRVCSYAEAGTYTVTLIARDVFGNESRAEREVKVTAPTVYDVSVDVKAPETGFVGEEVSFDITVSCAIIEGEPFEESFLYFYGFGKGDAIAKKGLIELSCPGHKTLRFTEVPQEPGMYRGAFGVLALDANGENDKVEWTVEVREKPDLFVTEINTPKLVPPGMYRATVGVGCEHADEVNYTLRVGIYKEEEEVNRLEERGVARCGALTEHVIEFNTEPLSVYTVRVYAYPDVPDRDYTNNYLEWTLRTGIPYWSDVSVDIAKAPREAFVNEPYSALVSVSCNTNNPRHVTLTGSFSVEGVEKNYVVLLDCPGEKNVEVGFVPESAGVYTLRFEIEPLPDENDVSDNAVEWTVEAKERPSSVDAWVRRVSGAEKVLPGTYNAVLGIGCEGDGPVPYTLYVSVADAGGGLVYRHVFDGELTCGTEENVEVSVELREAGLYTFRAELMVEGDVNTVNNVTEWNVEVVEPFCDVEVFPVSTPREGVVGEPYRAVVGLRCATNVPRVKYLTTSFTVKEAGIEEKRIVLMDCPGEKNVEVGFVPESAGVYTLRFEVLNGDDNTLNNAVSWEVNVKEVSTPRVDAWIKKVYGPEKTKPGNYMIVLDVGCEGGDSTPYTVRVTAVRDDGEKVLDQVRKGVMTCGEKERIVAWLVAEAGRMYTIRAVLSVENDGNPSNNLVEWNVEVEKEEEVFDVGLVPISVPEKGSVGPYRATFKVVCKGSGEFVVPYSFYVDGSVREFGHVALSCPGEKLLTVSTVLETTGVHTLRLELQIGDDNLANNVYEWAVTVERAPDVISPVIEVFNVSVEGMSAIVEWRVVDESPVEVTLDCGNGEVYEGLPAEGSRVCSYAEAGTYTVTLIARDVFGNESRAEREVTVVSSMPEENVEENVPGGGTEENVEENVPTGGSEENVEENVPAPAPPRYTVGTPEESGEKEVVREVPEHTPPRMVRIAPAAYTTQEEPPVIYVGSAERTVEGVGVSPATGFVVAGESNWFVVFVVVFLASLAVFLRVL